MASTLLKPASGVFVSASVRTCTRGFNTTKHLIIRKPDANLSLGAPHLTRQVASSAVQHSGKSPDDKVKVWVVYYSMYGHIAAMANAVLKGVNSVDGVDGKLYQVSAVPTEWCSQQWTVTCAPGITVVP